MLTLDELKMDFNEINKALLNLKKALNFDMLNSKKSDLEKKQQEDGFWEDMKKAKTINKELSYINGKIDRYNKLAVRVSDIEVLIELSEEANSQDEYESIDKEIKAIDKEIGEFKISILLTGKYDPNNAILSLHAGAGGTEAQDWVQMLYRMYTRFAERSGYKVTVIDSLAGEDAGIKSITFKVDGENAYGYLKAEMGVHRLVRISPFNAAGKRMTSFASLEVMPEIEDDDDIVINPDDIRIDVFRSSGAGGQKVNKTDTAIRITHFPTGIVVTCQNERSQLQNKEVAFQILRSKLVELRERERLEKETALKGNIKKIEWGSQIRSYTFCPYTLVKDLRTGYENTNIAQVMDGDLEGFINDYLVKANECI